jgi:anaerobic sulfite reductase subunit C
MQWTPEAEQAIAKVPFFVRKRVRQRVEGEAAEAGQTLVTLAIVKTAQARYLSGMAKEIRGYQLDQCFGPSGCPHRAVAGDQLLTRIRDLLEGADLLGFLRQTVDGELKFHHEFRISLADCPNACSQPQIKDIGILGACGPALGDAAACTQCGACVEACPEQAVRLDEAVGAPVIDMPACLLCGRCPAACPTGSLTPGLRGYRVQLGGKLGRHPRLARELPGVHSEDEVLGIVAQCLDFYKRHSRNGQRFAELLSDAVLEAYVRQGRFPD